MSESSTEIRGHAGIRGGGTEIGIERDFTLLHEDKAITDLLENLDVKCDGIDRAPDNVLPAQMADNAKELRIGRVPVGTRAIRKSRLYIRCDAHERQLLDRAATYARVSISEFVLSRALASAKQVVRARFLLSPVKALPNWNLPAEAQ